MEYKIHILGIEEHSYDQDPIQEDQDIYINALVDDLNSLDKVSRVKRDGHPRSRVITRINFTQTLNKSCGTFSTILAHSSTKNKPNLSGIQNE